MNLSFPSPWETSAMRPEQELKVKKSEDWFIVLISDKRGASIDPFIDLSSPLLILAKTTNFRLKKLHFVAIFLK